MQIACRCLLRMNTGTAVSDTSEAELQMWTLWSQTDSWQVHGLFGWVQLEISRMLYNANWHVSTGSMPWLTGEG